jgi:NB-ARC domain
MIQGWAHAGRAPARAGGTGQGIGRGAMAAPRATQLLDAKGDAVAAITAALRGAGGYGKTTLAKALAHDPDIQDAYFDGILWAVLGEKPNAVK